jgi:V/A-type H+-transporting ATPase subunit E
MTEKFSNLKKLTEELYEQTVKKADASIEKRKSEAKRQEEQIIAEAKLKAESIIKQAQKEAEQLQRQVNKELEQKGLEIIKAFHAKTEAALQEEIIQKPVQALFSDIDFIKELCLKLAENWDGTPLSMTMPQEWQARLEAQIKAKLPGLNLKFDDSKQSVFEIAVQKDGLKYKVDAEAFEGLFQEFLSERTKAILFKDNG